VAQLSNSKSENKKGEHLNKKTRTDRRQTSSSRSWESLGTRGFKLYL